jgi:hypothetical protein
MYNDLLDGIEGDVRKNVEAYLTESPDKINEIIPYFDIDKNKNLRCNEENWKYITDNYTKEECKQAIMVIISKNKLPFPTKDVDDKKVMNKLITLSKKPHHEFLKYDESHLRLSYKNNKSLGFVLTDTGTYNSISVKYHFIERHRVDSQKPNVYDRWTTGLKLSIMFSPIFNLNTIKEFDDTTIFTAFRFQGAVSQFKVGNAKAIIDMFNSKRVLDFCSGWGDRLAGFYASNAESYIGIDANFSLQYGYEQQRGLYSERFPDKNVRMISSPSEKVNYKNLNYKPDLIFTSPPYFDAEKYAGEYSSTTLYNTVDSWKDNFLFPTLKKTYDILEDDGFIVLNIADYQLGSSNESSRISYCDAMVDYMKGLPDCNFLGYFGMTISKRPNTVNTQEEGGVFVEPVWVFRKGNKEFDFDKVVHNKIQEEIDDLFE